MPKSNKEPKISLKLLKQLVGELESSLATAEGIKAEKTDENVTDYVVEMSKCTGLAVGIAKEATLLVGDIQQMITINTSPMPSSKDDLLASILGPLKGGGTLPGSN